MRSRALRAVIVVLTGTLGPGLITSGCNPVEGPPTTVMDPAGVGIIASSDLGGDTYRYDVGAGERLLFPRNTTRTLEATGSSRPGDLLAHGQDATGSWVAIFRALAADEFDERRGWAVQGPAWLQEDAVIFDSGLRLKLAPDFTREPTAQPPSEDGYVPEGTFLLDDRAAVLALQ
jgi:hypothetical protein